MTRAYASVGSGGASVTPYGIRRVTTTDNTILYQHPPAEPRTLVAPWVAAQMTELLQGVVQVGTGRAAQLGRPTAGKTGTTTSNKDGWFIGFSSGITTGVWMGRDDNRALPGLSGGRAPAAAFHDYMARAVANRPVEQFATDVTGTNGRSTRATTRFSSPRPTTSRWSTRTAIRSSRRRRPRTTGHARADEAIQPERKGSARRRR